MTKYFITGATGFVGSYLVRELCGPQNKLYCLTHQRTQSFFGSESIQWIQGDLLDKDSYKDVLKNTDCVFHLAGLLSARRKELYTRINVDGTETLLEACKDVGASIKRFVHMSSIAVLGPNHDGNLLQETDPCTPQSEYGKSKYLAEKVALRYSQSFPVVILRPAFIYGRGDLRGLQFLKSLNNPVALLWISHIKTICLCHVTDIIQSCLLSIEKDIESGDIFIISNPGVCTWGEVWETLEEIFHELFGLEIHSRNEHRSPLVGKQLFSSFDSSRNDEFLYWACDISKAQEVLEFRPKMTLKKGAYDAIRWYVDNGLFGKEDVEQILKRLGRR
jgi:nucleoside-diphosphate-sugar epimerase